MEYDSFRIIVLDHASRYPLMQPADWYKLAHQAALGSEHAVGSIEMVHAYLQQEIAALGAGPDEPLLDPVSADGRIVRVHLRPYVQNGFSVMALVQAFVRTAAAVHGATKDLEEYLNIMIDLTRENKIKLKLDVLTDYFRQLSAVGYPPVHHSPEYTRAYLPAYRVIAKDFLSEEINIQSEGED